MEGSVAAAPSPGQDGAPRGPARPASLGPARPASLGPARPASLEQALAALPNTPPRTIPGQESRIFNGQPFYQSPIRMAAQHQNTIDRTIGVPPLTPPSLPNPMTERPPFTRQTSAPNKTLVTPQGSWQNVSAPSMPQETLPAVQNFIQLAFQTVQRSSKPQMPQMAPPRFPHTPLVIGPRPQTSLPAPFPSLQKPSQEPPKPTDTNRQMTEKLNGQTPNRSDAKINQPVSRSQSYPPHTIYNTSLGNCKQPTQAQNKPETSNAEPNPPTKRPVLVAKRRHSPKPEAQESNVSSPAVEKPQSQKAQNSQSSQSKAKDSPVKQNSSRVAQSFKDSGLKGGNAQSTAGGSGQRPSWRKTSLEEEDEIDPKKRVLVSGFPPYTQAQDLIRVLSKFGVCQVDSCRNRLAVVTFENETQAKNAMKYTDEIKIYGEYIDIRPYTNPRHVEELYKAYKKVLTVQKGQDITMPDKIDLSGDFYSQLLNIQTAIQLSSEQALAVNNLYNDLELVLQQEWPGCVAIPFGSIPTGLGIKSSDADCYVELPTRLRPRGAAGGAAAFVTRARRLLQQYPQVFTHLIAIPRANTPIVKFRHEPSGFHCDVSAKTPLGAQNSKLIKLLFENDVRLQRVAILIKYWAKVHDLSGTGRLTNYALTMMVIFYLQQTPVPHLPPVEKLQWDPETRYVVDNWNAGFLNRKIPLSSQNLTIPQILGGFFEFYEKFNFEEDVICPFLGRPVKKLAFETPATLPYELSRYVANVRDNLASPLRHGTAFCVQDPFEQSHNVASSVGPKLGHEIRAYIKFAADAFRADRENQYNNFLRTILLTKPKIRPQKVTASTVLRLIPRVRGQIVDPDWRGRLREIIVDVIFEKILQLTLEKAPEDEKAKERQKRTKVDREKYRGVAQKAVWRRKRLESGPPGPEAAQALVSEQAAVTATILERPGPETLLRFELELWYREAPRTFELSFRMVEGDIDSFRQFVMFLHSAVLDWFRVLLRPYQAPLNEEPQVTLKADQEESAQAQAECKVNLETESDDSPKSPDPPRLGAGEIAETLEAVRLDSDSSDGSEATAQ